jgi:hypothetical protein
MYGTYVQRYADGKTKRRLRTILIVDVFYIFRIPIVLHDDDDNIIRIYLHAYA